MRKKTTLILLLSFPLILFGQELKFLGRLINAESQKPIKNANITILGTTTGTTSNFLGYFELVTEPTTIVVSHVQYNSSQVMLSANNTAVKIVMTPSLNELNALEINGSTFIDKFEYDKNLRADRMDALSKVNSQTGFGTVESYAEFPGGLKEFHKYLIHKLSVNKDSIKASIRAFAKFTVDNEGRVLIDSIFQIPTEYYKFVLDLFEQSPKWIPAYQRFKPKTTNYIQPLFFETNVEIIEVQPLYKRGGIPGLYKFFNKNVKYPKSARRSNVKGQVFVSFAINEEGNIELVSVEKGLGYGCDEEAVRLIQLTSGYWSPGTQNERPVKVKMTLPIRFKN